jgi:hypothetical protein
MEFILNLVWTLLAVAILCLWRRFSPRTGAGPHMQLVALALLILILFPVISVTDDLQAIQNAAETDTYSRRGHAVGNAHSIFPVVAALPPPVMAELSLGFLRFAAPSHLPTPVVEHPGLRAIQNRPPPVA